METVSHHDNVQGILLIDKACLNSLKKISHLISNPLQNSIISDLIIFLMLQILLSIDIYVDTSMDTTESSSSVVLPEMSSISSGGWTIPECLALVHAVLKYGDDNWLQVTKALKTYQQQHYQTNSLYSKDINNNNININGHQLFPDNILSLVARDPSFYTPSVSTIRILYVMSIVVWLQSLIFLL